MSRSPRGRLAQAVRVAMGWRDITTAQLAFEAGLHAATVRRMIQGERKTTRANVRHVAGALDELAHAGALEGRPWSRSRTCMRELAQRRGPGGTVAPHGEPLRRRGAALVSSYPECDQCRRDRRFREAFCAAFGGAAMAGAPGALAAVLLLLWARWRDSRGPHGPRPEGATPTGEVF